MSGRAKKLWERDDVRLAALAAAFAAFGLALPAGLVWGALMLWHRDFNRRFGEWYTRSVLVGLAAAAFLAYTISNPLDIPPSGVAMIFVVVGAYVGIRGQKSRRGWH